MPCGPQKRIVLPPVCMPPGCPPPCCPPPCCPQPCCPPCFPCMPACAPCCPPCPPKCCGPKVPCCPKPPCCPCPPGCCQPVNLCNCCGGKSTIICVPKGCPPPGCCSPCFPPCCPPCCSPCCPPSCCPPPCGPPAGAEEKPASFNNCNFYCSELPKGLKPNGNGCFMDPMCLEDDPCCDDGLNRAAGDDQLAPVPRSGATSSYRSTSRQGGGSSYKSYGLGSKKGKLSGAGRKRSSNVEEEEDEGYDESAYAEGASSKGGGGGGGGGKGKGSYNTPSYSYNKSTIDKKLARQKPKVKAAQAPPPAPKNTAQSSTPTRNKTPPPQKAPTLQAPKYSTFAKALKPREVNMEQGDAAVAEQLVQVRSSGRDKLSVAREKVKIEEILFPVRFHSNAKRDHQTESRVLPDKDAKISTGEVNVSALLPLGNQQHTKNQKQVHEIPEIPTKSSEFSTQKIFGRTVAACVSSSTISAPPNCTPLTQVVSTHAPISPFVSPGATTSNLRRSKSLDLLLQKDEKTGLKLITMGDELNVSDAGDLLRNQNDLRPVLKTADDIQKVLTVPEHPVVVMTCLIERGKMKDARKQVHDGALRESKDDKNFIELTPSELTGVTSETSKNCSAFYEPASLRAPTTPRLFKPSNVTLESFQSSGMTVLPPSTRRLLPSAVTPIHQNEVRNTDESPIKRNNSIRTVTLPLLRACSWRDKDNSSFESSRSYETSEPEVVTLPSLCPRQNLAPSSQRKPPLKEAAAIGFALPTIPASSLLKFGSGESQLLPNGACNNESSTGVTLSPLRPICCVRTENDQHKMSRAVGCIQDPQNRRKRKARRILTSNNGCFVQDLKFTQVSGCNGDIITYLNRCDNRQSGSKN